MFDQESLEERIIPYLAEMKKVSFEKAMKAYYGSNAGRPISVPIALALIWNK